MQLSDPNNPNEKKKIIAAVVLGLAAIITLGYLFLGGGSKKPTKVAGTPTPTPGRGVNNPPPTGPGDEDLTVFQPIAYHGTGTTAPEADRNVFAYWEPPPKPVKPLPTPTPTPPPPLTVTSLSPASVFGQTGEFSLQVAGDKFTPAVRITIDGRAMPTRFINTQQVATTVTADMIANAGSRRVEVRTPDGALYSNVATLVVTRPPEPNYNYVGLIGKPRFNDTAVLQDKGSKEYLNVQRGDVVGGRFRVNSISDKEIIFIDTTLKIRHPVKFSAESSTGGRPPVRRPVVEDEPQEF